MATGADLVLNDGEALLDLDELVGDVAPGNESPGDSPRPAKSDHRTTRGQNGRGDDRGISMDLANKANAIEPRTGTSPWPDHEHVRGYAVLMLPFSSGDLLGLRVWPRSDFVPYASV